jgi:hypothetical protein
MVQNRNKLIELFVSNLANSIVHEILERAIDKEEIADKYRKEIKNSFKIAKNYRNKINPVNFPLPAKDFLYIEDKIKRKVNAELKLRISKGYQNIDLNLVDLEVEKYLKQLVVF